MNPSGENNFGREQHLESLGQGRTDSDWLEMKVVPEPTAGNSSTIGLSEDGGDRKAKVTGRKVDGSGSGRDCPRMLSLVLPQ